MKNIMKFRNVNTTDEEKQIEEQLREAFDRFSQDTSEDQIKEKGIDTEKKLNAIDLQAAVDNGFTAAEIAGIVAMQKAIKTHTLYTYLQNGKDPEPSKKEVKKNADDDRESGTEGSSWNR